LKTVLIGLMFVALAACSTTGDTSPDQAPDTEAKKPAHATKSVFSEVGVCGQTGSGMALGGCTNSRRSQAKKLNLGTATKKQEDSQETFMEKVGGDGVKKRKTTDNENADDQIVY
jgi:hypothetical protein